MHLCKFTVLLAKSGNTWNTKEVLLLLTFTMQPCLIATYFKTCCFTIRTRQLSQIIYGASVFRSVSVTCPTKLQTTNFRPSCHFIRRLPAVPQFTNMLGKKKGTTQAFLYC